MNLSCPRYRHRFYSPLRSLSRAASDYSSDSAVCFGILRPLRPLREIKDKSDFVFHAKSAKSAEIYSLSCFTLALESTEWHSFHCACLAGCQLMCFVFIRFHRAIRRDEVCDKFCVFNFFCSLVFYSLLINQFCVFREFRVKQILLSHRLYPYFGNAPP